MTTSVRVHVNGRYRALVTQDALPTVIVEGNYEGSPNPTGEAYFNLRGSHPTKGVFTVVEEYLGEAPPKPALESSVSDWRDAPADSTGISD